MYDEAVGRERKMGRDEWAHGSLLIINEMLKCSNVEGEVRGRGRRRRSRVDGRVNDANGREGGWS